MCKLHYQRGHASATDLLVTDIGLCGKEQPQSPNADGKSVSANGKCNVAQLHELTTWVFRNYAEVQGKAVVQNLAKPGVGNCS